MVNLSLLDTTNIKEQLKNRILENLDSYTVLDSKNVLRLNLNVSDLVDNYIKEQNLVEPRICITTDAYAKMQMLIMNTSTEIGWYGTVEEHPELNTYIINDIIVYPQIVTGATVEQDEDRMFEFEMSLTDDQVNHKRFHGHSHVNMGVGPSSTDENFYEELLTQITDYFIIMIKNKKGEQTVRFYDKRSNVVYEGLPVEVIQNDGLSLGDWYDEVADNSVKRYTPPATTYKYTSPYKKETKIEPKKETKKETKYSSPMTDEEWEDYFNACDRVYDNPYDYVVSEKDYFR